MKFHQKIRQAFGYLLSIILPRDCSLCGERVMPPDGARGPVCESCARSLARISDPRCPRCGKALISEMGYCLDCRGREFECPEILPLFMYADAAAELVAAYKTRGRTSLAVYFAGQMEGEIRSRWPGWTIVPVPPRPEKIRSGTRDQIETLARVLEARGFPVERVLARARSEQQKHLGREERLANSKAAYSMAPGKRAPEKALILDDVFTTGATVEACAAALKGGGAKAVAAIVIAAD